MELKKYSSYNEHKDMSLLQEIRRAKINIFSDQGRSDQVIKNFSSPDGEVRWGASRRETIAPQTSHPECISTLRGGGRTL